MEKLQTFIHQIEKTITDNTFINKHRIKPSHFTRNTAKLTFDKLITYLLSLPRQSAQIALNNHIKQKGYNFTMEKQSLFEAREKLPHRIYRPKQQPLPTKLRISKQ